MNCSKLIFFFNKNHIVIVNEVTYYSDTIAITLLVLILLLLNILVLIHFEIDHHLDYHIFSSDSFYDIFNLNLY